MFKIIKYVIFPIIIVILLVTGVILSLNSNVIASSIGVGVLSSSIVSIVVWLYQFTETLEKKNNIKKNLYNLIKREFIIKLGMASVFLLNDNGTLCTYLSDLSKEASKCYKKSREEHMVLYLERFIGTGTFSGYTHQVMRLLDYSLNQNIIPMEDFKRLNSMFQYEISISKLLNEGDKHQAVGFFSYFLDNMIKSINNDKNLKVFSDITIRDDEFFIDTKKLSKEDKGLFDIFSGNKVSSK